MELVKNVQIAMSLHHTTTDEIANCMIRAGFPIGLQKIYYFWIHKHRYVRNR